MWFGVLGPLEARDDAGEQLRVGGRARRQLLAALLCRAGRTVSPATLLDDLWGDAPPRSAAKTLQSHMVRLRDDLGREAETVLKTEAGGYRLDVTADDVDATAFVGLLDRARSPDAEPTRAIADLDSALALWRGEAYLDFGDAAFAVTERVRLSELRIHALEVRTDLALNLGQNAGLISELEQRVAVAPYRERSWEQLILALYRAGRQADALATYGRVRDLLGSELGVDPGPGLMLLEQRILRHDDDLLARPSEAAHAAVLRANGTDVSEENPYLGLVSYSEQDADIFVGRERLIADVTSQLNDRSLTVVTGASGSGKSSLVRAGVVPALRRGALPGSGSWRITHTTPSAFTNLDSTPDLLVLDQAEELFTVLDDDARADLLRALDAIVHAELRAVIVIRGDYFGRLADFPTLAAQADAATILVPPMRDDELARVVSEPAARRGAFVEPALLDAALAEAHGQSGALPMLSQALAEAWRLRDGSCLTLDGYRRGGGVARAIEANADRVYESLDDTGRRQARGLLVRLATRDSASWVRRPLSVNESLEHASDTVLNALAHGRLVTLESGRVEISHEALLTHWPRLAGWLEERSSDAEMFEHLRAAERAWRATDRTDSDLYRGTRLQIALDRRTERPEDFSEAEKEFLDASAGLSTRELAEARLRAEREARGRRRLRVIAGALAVVVVMACLAALVSVRERRSAQISARRAAASALTADASKVAAESSTVPDLRTSLLLASAAYRLQDSPDTRSGLLSAVERGGAPLYRIQTASRVQWVGINATGTTLWEMDNHRRVHRYDAAGRTEIGSFPARADHVVAQSPDSRLLVAVGTSSFSDAAGATRAIVLDANTGALVRVLRVSAVVAGTAVRSAAFTGTGRWLAVIEAGANGPDTPAPSIAVFDVNQLGASPRTLHFAAPVIGVAASRDRFAIQTADGRVQLADAASLRIVSTIGLGVAQTFDPHHVDMQPLAMTADGRYVALVHDEVPEIVRTSAPSAQAVPTQRVGQYVQSLAFSAGNELAAGGNDGSVEVFRLDGNLAVRETGNDGQVMSVVWSGDRRTPRLYAGGLDSQIVVYDVRQQSRQLTFGPATRGSTGGVLRTGDRLVSVTPQEGLGRESAVRLWVADAVSGAVQTYPLHLRDDDYIGAFTADDMGRRALVTVQHSNGTISCRLYDLTTGEMLREFVPTTAVSPHQTFVGIISPDGSTAAVSIGDRRLGFFDLPAGALNHTVDLTFAGSSGDRTLAMPVAFAPENSLLVMGDDPGSAPPPPPSNGEHLATEASASVVASDVLERIDIGTGRSDGQVPLGSADFIGDLAWSPDRTRFAVGTASGTLTVVSTRTMAAYATQVPAVPGVIMSVGWSPDARTIVTAATNGTFSLWAADTVRRVGPPVTVGDGAVSIWFDDAGDLHGYLQNSDTNTLTRFSYPARPDEWLATACRTAGDTLTRAEWDRYVTDRPYFTTCS